MIRALTIGFLTVTSAVLSATVAKAESCDWTATMYEKKVSDVCQKELEGKASNEQDKVYVRRMFKDWQPLPATTEVLAEGGMMQLSDESDGSLFQAQWISKEPAMMWINGAVVSDVSTDTSVYRRLERMFEAAEQQAPSTSAMNPFRMLFQVDEAKAARASRNLNAAFVYTLDNGFTGTASEILTGEGEDGKLVGGALPDRQGNSFIGLFATQRDEYQCNGKTIGDTELTIDGKKVKVHQSSHNTFMIKGLVEGQDVQVNMTGRPMLPAELRQTLTNKKTGKRYTAFGTPCQNIRSKDLDAACKDKWTEWAAKNEEAKTAIKDAGANAIAGKDFSCRSIYKGSENRAKLVECAKYFRQAFPRGGGLRYHADSATFSLCADRAGKASCEVMKKGAKDVLATADPKLRDEKRDANLKVASDARKQYRDALVAAGFKNADEFCKMPEAQGSVDDFGRTGEISLEPCKMPAKSVLPKDKKAAANLRLLEMRANNPNRVEFEGASAELQAKVERRMLGLMMLGDCCNDQRCSQKIYDSRKINLKGAVQGPAAPVKQ